MTNPQQVWLLDDDSSILDALAQGLSLEGWQCRTFTDPASLLSQLTPDFAGVIVTDLNMPQQDGLSVLAAILKRDAELPVIFNRLWRCQYCGYGDAGWCL